MGDDMQDWCDARLSWASQSPLGLTDAVEYYYGQVTGRLTDERDRARLYRWRESVTYKISIVRLIRLGATPAQGGPRLGPGRCRGAWYVISPGIRRFWLIGWKVTRRPNWASSSPTCTGLVIVS